MKPMPQFASLPDCPRKNGKFMRHGAQDFGGTAEWPKPMPGNSRYQVLLKHWLGLLAAALLACPPSHATVVTYEIDVGNWGSHQIDHSYRWYADGTPTYHPGTYGEIYGTSTGHFSFSIDTRAFCDEDSRTKIVEAHNGSGCSDLSRSWLRSESSVDGPLFDKALVSSGVNESSGQLAGNFVASDFYFSINATSNYWGETAYDANGNLAVDFEKHYFNLLKISAHDLLFATIDGQELPVGILGNRPVIEVEQSFQFHDFRYNGVNSNGNPQLLTVNWGQVKTDWYTSDEVSVSITCDGRPCIQAVDEPTSGWLLAAATLALLRNRRRGNCSNASNAPVPKYG